MPAKSRFNAILISFTVALLLSIVSIPSWAEYFRPLWLLAVIIYWSLYLDSKVGVGIAWSLGVLLDLLYGSLLGEHAIGLVIVSYIVIKLQRQIRMFPVSQQAAAVFVLSLVYLGLIFWIQTAIHKMPNSWMFWLNAFITALLWPWIAAILSSRQQRIEAL